MMDEKTVLNLIENRELARKEKFEVRVLFFTAATVLGILGVGTFSNVLAVGNFEWNALCAIILSSLALYVSLSCLIEVVEK